MAFEDEVTADAPELWWDTRQASGVSQPDASGNGHTGTLLNGPTLDPVNGILFNGAGQRVVSNANVEPIGSVSTFAVEAVIKRAGGSYHVAGFSASPSSDGYMALLVFNTPDFSYNLLNAVDGPDDIPLGTLTHVMGTYDGTDLKLFVDGVEVATAAIAADDAVFAVAQPFKVGDDGFSDEFNGNIQHAIYYRGNPPSPARVAAHAAAALEGPPATPDFPTLTLDSDIGDLTPYGEQPAFNIQRGTSSPLVSGMVADAGVLATVLDNITRDLDPDNASGPFFGSLRPKVATAATVTWGPTTYDLLTGRVDDWPQGYPFQGVDQNVDFKATDLFQWLANTPINTARPPERTGARIQAVLNSIDYPGPTDIAPGMSKVCGQDLSTVAALSHLGDCAQVEYGEFGIDGTGTLYFRDRPAIATDARSTVVQSEYAQSGGLNFADLTRGSLPLINYVTVSFGVNGGQVTVLDQDSIDDFDMQPASISLPFETYSQARVYAKWLLLLYAQPRTAFRTVTFTPYNAFGDTFDLWADVLSRQEGDLIQITLDPLNAPYTLSGDPIVETCWIRGINYEFDAQPQSVTFTVQSDWLDGLFFWDTSELDGPDHYGM